MGQSVCPRLYVCEECGRLGVMADFQDECRPGWTHGRLVGVEEVSHAAVGAVAEQLTPRGLSDAREACEEVDR